MRLPATAAAAAPPTDLDSQDDEEQQDSGPVTVICSQEAGTQIIQHQDSLTDYCSISSCGTQEVPGSPESTGFDPMAPSPAEPDRESSVQDPQDSPRDSAGIPSPPPLKLQAFTVLPVNGTVWIPR